MLLSEYPNQPISPISLRILSVATTEIDSGWDAADVCTTYWRCYVNESEGARVRVGHYVYEITPGRVHFIPAWVTFSCLNNLRIQHFYSHFDLMGLSAALVKESFPSPLSIPVSGITEKLYTQLYEADGAVSMLMKTNAFLYHCIGSLIGSLPPKQKSNLTRYLSDPFNGLVPFIESQLSAKLRNQDLARFCNLSEDYFIKQFKATMKVSPGHYVTERRIVRAAERLIFSDDTIDSVAESCGFPNRHYFTRVFTKYMGLPPGQFRKSSHP